ncbi:hypothetical protein M8Z33_32290 [Streptomyces sp. ZAF1911]|uniref:hypothetical protein n=1 Tax=Streptomyces sp. ZAF1911 TaxID=2944129 RepID=UPI00237A5201|nr:hypothetical protein [Streptomyces sp. ZAF1911]MDD9381251.1 hypothetical protein [Streptomyces sp. ZAF1911]
MNTFKIALVAAAASAVALVPMQSFAVDTGNALGGPAQILGSTPVYHHYANFDGLLSRSGYTYVPPVEGDLGKILDHDGNGVGLAPVEVEPYPSTKQEQPAPAGQPSHESTKGQAPAKARKEQPQHETATAHSVPMQTLTPSTPAQSAPTTNVPAKASQGQQTAPQTPTKTTSPTDASAVDHNVKPLAAHQWKIPKGSCNTGQAG